jgi:hypothetical protein
MAVNLSPVGGVAAQFFTNTGAVLTGGKIYTYAAGTTTPATTFTSSNGLTPWTNPIVLDAAGRVSGSGEIWLTDGINYKFLLKDANDVLIATYDNISGINSNFVAFVNQQQIITATANQTVFNLSISYQPGTNSLSVFVDGVNQYGPGAQYAYTETDSDTVTFVSGLHVGAEVKFTTTQQQSAGAVNASQVTYNPAGTGAVATNVQAKLRQTVSVMDFGAVGDGVTNDTAAIQAAIDTTKDIFVPDGNYLVTSTLDLDNPRQTIFGNGLKSKITFTFASSQPAIEITNSIGLQRIENMFLYATANCSKLISLQAPRVQINGCYLQNDTAGGHVVYVEDENVGSNIFVFGFSLQNSFVYGSLQSGDYGLRLGLYSQDATIFNNYFENCGTLLLIDSETVNINIEQNVFQRSVDYAIDLSATTGFAPIMAAVRINQNYFEDNTICVRTADASIKSLTVIGNYAARGTGTLVGGAFYFADLGSPASSENIAVKQNYVVSFETVFKLDGQYNSRLTDTSENTLFLMTTWSNGTYADWAYSTVITNGFFQKQLTSGTLISENVQRIQAQTATIQIPVYFNSTQYVEKVVFRYVPVGGAQVVATLFSLPTNTTLGSASAVGTVTATTEANHSISVNSFGLPQTQYYMQFVFSGGTSGYVYPPNVYIRG